MRKKLRGMTLVEVISALAVIFLVSAFAYAGINTAASFMMRGADIRQERCRAQSEIESKIYSEHNDEDFSDYKDSQAECIIDGSSTVNINVRKITSDEDKEYIFRYFAPAH